MPKMPWQKDPKDRDKPKDKDADSAEGQGTETTEATAQQPGPDNLLQGEGAGSGSGDDLNRPTATPVGPGPDAQGSQGYADPQTQQAYYAQQGYPTQQAYNPQAQPGYSPQAQQGHPTQQAPQAPQGYSPQTQQRHPTQQARQDYFAQQAHQTQQTQQGYANPQTQQGYPTQRIPPDQRGQVTQTEGQGETVHAQREQQQVAGDVVDRAVPTIAGPMPPADATTNRIEGATGSPQPDGALRSGSDTATAKVMERPQIAMPTQPAVAGQVDNEQSDFPEPVVIGAMPTLRSDPRGLPQLDQVPGPALPDSVLDGADFEGLLIRGASLRGDRHRYEATVRQDSMGIWRVGDRETQAILVCVTDGVSSEPLSHRGAAEACRLLRDAVALDVSDFFKGSKRRTKTAWADMAGDISKGLNSVASYLGVAPKSLSTTLAAALIELNPPDPAGRRFVVLNVGDATAFSLGERKFSALLEDPHDTTITSTGTYALPTSVGEVGVDTGTIGPGEMLMVCTDGMSNPMRNEDVRAQLVEWWGSGRVPSMPEFGWQMSYRAKTYDDDRTAICVWGC